MTRRISTARPKRGRRAVEIVRSGASVLIGHVPRTVHATRRRAQESTTALQGLPDATLRWLAATSLGLGAGLHLAGAPRLVTAAGLAPAAFLGAAIALRPRAPLRPEQGD